MLAWEGGGGGRWAVSQKPKLIPNLYLRKHTYGLLSIILGYLNYIRVPISLFKIFEQHIRKKLPPLLC